MTIDIIVSVLAWLCIAGGAFFIIVAGIGLLRMPDVYTRMHAAGIADTMGTGLLVIGMVLTAGFSLVSAKLLIILAVILFTSPVATHALAQATLHAGIEPRLARQGRRPAAERGGSGKKASTRKGRQPSKHS